MKYRESQLLQMLISNQSMTGEEFSSIFNVSSRTIRSDIKSINQEISKFNLEITASHGQGYSLNVSEEERQILMNYLLQHEGTVKHEPVFRVKSLLLALAVRDEVNLYDLAEELYVSESSILSDIRYLESLFRNRNLKLKIGRRGDYLNLKNCTEKDLRIGLTLALVDEFSELDNAALLELNHVKIDFKKIRRSVFEVTYANNIRMTDHEYMFITTYIFVVALREIRNQTLENPSTMETLKGTHHVVREITEKASVEIGREGTEEIVTLIENMHITGQQKVDETDLYNRIQRIAESLDRQYGTELGEDTDFLCALTSHLESYMKKNAMNIYFSEDVIQEFRNYYPLSYTLAQYLNENIQDILDRHHVCFSDKEIAFIATHFQASMEKHKSKSQMKVALVCSYGIGTTKLLETQIKREFPNLTIEMTVASFTQDLQNFDEIDLIISTVPIKLPENIPWILVDVPLTLDNIESIKKAIRSDFYWTKHIYPLVLDLPQELTTEEDTMPYLEEVITYIEGTNLPIEKLLTEREKLLTTNLGKGIAMPHALFSSPLKYHIYFFKHVGGVQWGPSKARLIAVILINEESKGYLNDYMLKINKIYTTMDFNTIQLDEIRNFMDIIN